MLTLKDYLKINAPKLYEDIYGKEKIIEPDSAEDFEQFMSEQDRDREVQNEAQPVARTVPVAETSDFPAKQTGISQGTLV